MHVACAIIAMFLSAGLDPVFLDGDSILKKAFEREQSLPEGRLDILCVTDSPLNPYWGAAPEKDFTSLRLQTSWKTKNIFRISIYDGETELRSIVSDGKHIDTGNCVVWDVRFLSQWSMHANKKRGMEFFNLIWPYRLLGDHVFPLSQGCGEVFMRSPIQVEVMPAESGSASPNEREGLVHLKIYPDLTQASVIIKWLVSVDPDAGHTIMSYQFMHGNDVLQRYEYRELYQVTEDIWIPMIFSNLSSDVSLTSEVDPDSVDFEKLSPGSDFVVDVDAAQSKMKWRESFLKYLLGW